MKGTRMRTVVAVGASALMMLGAGLTPAAAALAPVVVDKLPANVKLADDQAVSVNVVAAPVCAAGTEQFKAFVPGKHDAVTGYAAAVCEAGTLKATITENLSSKKKSAVVKFTAIVTASGEKVVQTMVVHVTKTKAPNPNKPNKP